MAGKPIHGKRMGAGIYVKFPIDIDEKIRQMADEDVRPISSVIRKIVMQYFAEDDGRQAPTRQASRRTTLGTRPRRRG